MSLTLQRKYFRTGLKALQVPVNVRYCTESRDMYLNDSLDSLIVLSKKKEFLIKNITGNIREIRKVRENCKFVTVASLSKRECVYNDLKE